MKKLLGALALAAASGCARAPQPPAESPPTEAPRVEASASPAALLEEPAGRAERAGASPLELLGTAATVAGDSVSGLVNVPAGRCALLFARGTSGIEDIDLIVFAEDGSELGADEAPDDKPHVVVCPERSTRVFVSARVIQGRGVVSVGVQDLPPSAREQVLWALGVERTSTEELAQGWPGLERALNEHRSALGGSWIDLRRVAVPVDARVPTRVSAEIPANRCVDALLLPSDEIGRLDLEAVDESGRIFARAWGRSSTRSLLLCGGAEKTPVSFEVRPESGRGLALLVLSTSRAAKEELSLKSSARSVDAAPRRAPALGKSSTPLRKERTLLEVGAIQTLSFEQEGCARLVLLPEEPLFGVDAQLWSPSGALLGRVETTTTASLFYCAATPGTRLDLTATRRSGPLRVELHTRWTPARIFLDHPLAGSRLLALAERVGLSSPPTPRAVEASAERLVLEDLEIPAGRCLTSLVALEQGAWGAEVRFVDRKTGLELSSGRGAEAAFARACAPPSGPLPVQLRFRPAQGRAIVLHAQVLDEPPSAP